MLSKNQTTQLIKHFQEAPIDITIEQVIESVHGDTDLYILQSKSEISNNTVRYALINSDYIGDSYQDFVFGLCKSEGLDPVRMVLLKDKKKFVLKDESFDKIMNKFALAKIR